MPVKVLDHFGWGNTADISDAIRWAADHGAKVINMSLGGGGRSEVMEHAVEYARAKGVVVVCAAGNGGRGVVEFPAAYPGCRGRGRGRVRRAPRLRTPRGARSSTSRPPAATSRRAKGPASCRTPSTRRTSAGPSTPRTRAPAWRRRTWPGWRRCCGRPARRAPTRWRRRCSPARRAPSGSTGWTEQYGYGVIDADAALAALKKIKSAEVDGAAPRGGPSGHRALRDPALGADAGERIGLRVRRLEGICLGRGPAGLRSAHPGPQGAPGLPQHPHQAWLLRTAGPHHGRRLLHAVRCRAERDDDGDGAPVA